MAMKKITCSQEEDGTRRIITEKWELLLKPLEVSAEHSKDAPIFKISYLKDGVEKWLGDLEMTEKSVLFVQQHPELSDEEKWRATVGIGILRQMALLEEV